MHGQNHIKFSYVSFLLRAQQSVRCAEWRRQDELIYTRLRSVTSRDTT